MPADAAPAEFVAPQRWSRIDLVSDLHLAPETPRTFAAFAAWLRDTPADAVFILGDLFEVWVGDDARHEGFEARCCSLLADAARRRTVGFMVGNRDFLAGAEFTLACGLTPLADPTLLAAFGARVLLTHGDALCLGDTEYQRYRAQVRDPAWQAMALALPLAERRRRAAQMRHASEQRQAGGGLASVDLDLPQAGKWMAAAGAATMVHGHTHRPASEALGGGRTRHVLSDWDFDRPGEARADVLSLSRSGFERRAVAQP